MEQKCTYCSKPCTMNDDGIFVCEEGHIAKFTQELTDAVQGTLGKSTKQKDKTVGLSEFKTYMYMFTELYHKMKPCLGFESDVVFKVYLSFFDREHVELFNFTFIYTVLYYSLRVHRERAMDVLTVRDFDDLFPYSLYMHTYNKLCDKYMIKRFMYYRRFFVTCYNVTVKTLADYVMFFGEVYIKSRAHGTFVPGYEENYNLENKRIFRTIVRRDKETMAKYLAKITAEMRIEVTDHMKAFFERFCDLYLIERRTFVPDIVVASFLFVYLMNVPTNLKLSEMEEALCTAETQDARFKRELEELILLNETSGSVKRYKEFRESYKVLRTHRPFFIVNKPVNRLKLIFSTYLRLTTNEFAKIVKNVLLFFDSCVDEFLFKEFYNYEKRRYFRTVECQIRTYQAKKMVILMRKEQKKVRRLVKKKAI